MCIATLVNLWRKLKDRITLKKEDTMSLSPRGRLNLFASCMKSDDDEKLKKNCHQ
jgi:hypothetical protein